jgi:putative membrane protein
MRRDDSQALASLEALVAELEARTRAELVLVLASRAEPYADAPWKAGCALALVTLGLLIFLPVDFRAEMLLLDAVLAFGLGFLLCRASPACARLLSAPARRREAVRRLAREQWTARAVGLTRERTGVLVLASWLEDRVELQWDVGVDQAVPLEAWGEVRGSLAARGVLRDFPEGLRVGLAPLGRVLAEHLPPGDDNPDELPNRPVVLP